VEDCSGRGRLISVVGRSQPEHAAILSFSGILIFLNNVHHEAHPGMPCAIRQYAEGLILHVYSGHITTLAVPKDKTEFLLKKIGNKIPRFMGDAAGYTNAHISAKYDLFAFGYPGESYLKARTSTSSCQRVLFHPIIALLSALGKDMEYPKIDPMNRIFHDANPYEVLKNFWQSHEMIKIYEMHPELIENYHPLMTGTCESLIFFISGHDAQEVCEQIAQLARANVPQLPCYMFVEKNTGSPQTLLGITTHGVTKQFDGWEELVPDTSATESAPVETSQKGTDKCTVV
jgi:hypothetical protein